MVEFKQSQEHVEPAGFANVPEGQRGQPVAETQKAVMHSVLKTLCAFLNSRGGTLLLGVHDSGDIIGIAPDFMLLGNKPNQDGFELKLTDLLKTRIRPVLTALSISFVPVDGKTVRRVDVLADSRAHYLDNRPHSGWGVRWRSCTGRLRSLQYYRWIVTQVPHPHQNPSRRLIGCGGAGTVLRFSH